MSEMNLDTLMNVLTKALGARIVHAVHQTEQLQGGTLGDVRLVSGIAETEDGEKLPYRVVWKTQKKWTRLGDPNSWRREYDLYTSGFGAAFAGPLRWPECFHAEINGDEIQIWMEYVEGVSGLDLTVDMLERAALELGRFQGRLHAQPGLAESITCFGDVGYMKRDYLQWHKGTHSYEFRNSDEYRVPEHVKRLVRRNPWHNDKTLEYNYLRFDECDIPQHLKQMLFEIDDNVDSVFAEIGKLPVVLCHRDFWNENIFVCGDEIRLIDWDTSGWGYLGEDIASLIADDVDFDNFEEYCRRLIPAYYRGIGEYMNISSVIKKYIREMIIIKFAYRFVQAHLFTTSREVKEEQIGALQKIYDFI